MLARLRFLPLLLAILISPLSARADFSLSVNLAPPPLPVYEQPYCPGPGYLWMPGYWAYDPGFAEYYWVPGTWVLPPAPGLLWTPGYWAWNGGAYGWYPGYWGPHVGFYGGINYGYGYPGSGFYGGYWRGNAYYYNRSVTRVDVRYVRNVYERNVVVNNNVRFNGVSFNGGNGGVPARPSSREHDYGREPRYRPTASQQQHQQFARQDRELRASENRGRPPIAAMPRPGAYGEHEVMPSRPDRRDDRGPDRDRGRFEPREDAQPAPDRSRLRLFGDQDPRRNNGDAPGPQPDFRPEQGPSVQPRRERDAAQWDQQQRQREYDLRQRQSEERAQQQQRAQEQERQQWQQQRQVEQQAQRQQREMEQQAQEQQRREQQWQQQQNQRELERQQRQSEQQAQRQQREMEQQQRRFEPAQRSSPPMQEPPRRGHERRDQDGERR